MRLVQQRLIATLLIQSARDQDCWPIDYYRRLLKIHPPSFLHTSLRQKWGGGICSNIQFVLCIHPSLRSSQSLICARSTIKMTAVAFWKNSSFDERLLQEINGTCVHAKPRGIEAICIVSSDRDDKVRVPNESNLKLGGGQRMRLCNLCVCVSEYSQRRS